MRKTLYLDGHAPLRVLLDGPALRVRRMDKADVLYPLRRLSRVVVSRQVLWDSETLLHCLAADVPVTFLDRKGRVAGICLGPGRRQPRLTEAWREFAGRPDWHAGYSNWFDAMEREAIREAAGRLGLRLPDLRAGQARRALVGVLQSRRPGVEFRPVIARLRGLAAAFTTEVASAGAFRPVRIGDGREQADLGLDGARLLEWDLWVMLIQHVAARQSAEPVPAGEDLVRLFEARTPRLRKLLDGYLDCLRRRAMALADPAGE